MKSICIFALLYYMDLCRAFKTIHISSSIKQFHSNPLQKQLPCFASTTVNSLSKSCILQMRSITNRALDSHLTEKKPRGKSGIFVLRSFSTEPGKNSSSAGVRIIQWGITISSLFMVFWVFSPFPGSAYVGMKWHAHLVHLLTSSSAVGSTIAPDSLFLKYASLGPAAGLLHAVPGAIWCALAPLQLNPAARAWAIRAGLHSPLGRAMLAAAAGTMCGLALFDSRRLFAEDVDFAGHGGAIADVVDGAGLLPMPFNRLIVRATTVWFGVAGVLAWAAARRRDFAAHRRWAIRHAGAGLWVAGQRPIFSLFSVIGAAARGWPPAADPAAQATAFYAATLVATLAYVAAAEWYARQDSDGAASRGAGKAAGE